MKKFRLGLNLNGKVEFVLDVVAMDFRGAASEWARLSGHSADGLFNAKKASYCGCKVVRTKLPAQQRKSELYGEYTSFRLI